jgi:predicted nucleic acid-binding protein
VILADTSVWVHHLRHGSERLARLLAEERVACHAFVIGELACGHLSNREEILTLLGRLPEAGQASHEEVLAMIEGHRLMGTGLGWVDAHLLGAALLHDLRLWTLDRRLDAAAAAIGVAATKN